MIVEIFSIKDVKLDAFSSPFSSQGEVQAKRTFHELVEDDKTRIHRYPSDFALYKLGTMNDSSGEMISKVKYLCSANTVRDSVLPEGD